DDRRVFSMGFSNGATLTGLLSCERSKDIAGFAMVAGSASCSPAAAKPAIIIHGLADPTVPYEPGLAMMRSWTTRNGCTARPGTNTGRQEADCRKRRRRGNSCQEICSETPPLGRSGHLG